MPTHYLILLFTIFFLTAFVFYFFLLNRTEYIKLKKKNDKGVRWGSQRKPIVGGVGFYVLFFIAFIISCFYTKSCNVRSIGIFSALTIAFAMGLIDDTKNSSPILKFIVQVANAVILLSCGVYINLFENDYVNYCITFFWVVGLMNSLNMLDNMDAITATNGLVIILMAVAFLIIFPGGNFEKIYLIGIIASLLAFLRWNWNPSKVYMGDNGSQFLGTILAVVGILYFWNNKPADSYYLTLRNFAGVILAFIVPLSDTTTVTINRLKEGKSPFVGGRDHTTHHLSYLGLSDKQVALVLMSISVITNILSFYLLFIQDVFKLYHFFIYTGIAFVIFGALYATTIFAKPTS